MLSIRSDPPLVDPSLVPYYVSGSIIQFNCQLAFAVLLFYDTITTMDNEVKYFWSSPRNFVSLMYFANRYIGLFAVIPGVLVFTFHETKTLCQFYIWSHVIGFSLTGTFINYILLMRVVALFSQDKGVSAFLRVLFALQTSSNIATVIYYTLYQQIDVGELAKGVIICGADRGISWVWTSLSWILSLTYALILMVLALFQSARYWRFSGGFKGFDLVKVLILDQGVYFMVVIFCSVANIMGDSITTTNDLVPIVLAALGNPAILCVLGSRLLINLKEAGERGLNGGTSYCMTMTDIEFS